MTSTTWARAWERSALGPGGFWLREQPARHFRTAVGPVLRDAMLALLVDVDLRLGSPSTIDVVDIGAGDGALLRSMESALQGTRLGGRVRWTGVDVRPRPHDLPAAIDWHVRDATAHLPDSVTGLVMAHEWLDEVPVDVIERDERGVDRVVLVDDFGEQALGPEVADDQRAWLAAWWPLADVGERAEIGLARDRAWSRLCAGVAAGTVIAVDYGHVRSERRPTLRAYREGELLDAIPDGLRNLTAHVAIDSCAAASPPRATVAVARQADALAPLAGALPDPAAVSAGDYAAALSYVMECRYLRAAKGLGGHYWLRADVG